MMSLGAFAPGSKVHLKWNSTGLFGQSATAASGTMISIYKGTATSSRSSISGVSDERDFAGFVGLNHFSVDLSNNDPAGYFEPGYEYFIIGSFTIDGIVGAVGTLATFTIAEPSSTPPPPVDEAGVPMSRVHLGM